MKEAEKFRQVVWTGVFVHISTNSNYLIMGDFTQELMILQIVILYSRGVVFSIVH